jgi:hypothetical protein
MLRKSTFLITDRYQQMRCIGMETLAYSIDSGRRNPEKLANQHPHSMQMAPNDLSTLEKQSPRVLAFFIVDPFYFRSQRMDRVMIR